MACRGINLAAQQCSKSSARFQPSCDLFPKHFIAPVPSPQAPNNMFVPHSSHEKGRQDSPTTPSRTRCRAVVTFESLPTTLLLSWEQPASPEGIDDPCVAALCQQQGGNSNAPQLARAYDLIGDKDDPDERQQQPRRRTLLSSWPNVLKWAYEHSDSVPDFSYRKDATSLYYMVRHGPMLVGRTHSFSPQSRPTGAIKKADADQKCGDDQDSKHAANLVATVVFFGKAQGRTSFATRQQKLERRLGNATEVERANCTAKRKGVVYGR